MRALLTLACFALTAGCTGEAEWALAPVDGPAANTGAASPNERTRLSAFQGLSSGLPASAAVESTAHLDGVLYAIANGALYRLPSGAANWEAFSLPGLNAGEKITQLIRYDLSLFISVADANNKGGVLELGIGDEKWSRKTPAGFPAVHSLLRKGSTLYAATSSGLQVSTSGGAFSVKTTLAPFNAKTKLLSASEAQLIFAVGATGALFQSDDFGRTFRATPTVKGAVKAIAASGAVVMVISASEGVLRSDNYGSMFHPLAMGPSPLSLAFNGKQLLAGTPMGLKVSDDAGLTFKTGGEGLPAQTSIASVFVAGPAVVAQANGQTFVAGLSR